MQPHPYHERCRRAAYWPMDVFVLWLGGMTWREAIRWYHWWVWFGR
jgi:hypothetical protein